MSKHTLSNKLQMYYFSWLINAKLFNIGSIFGSLREIIASQRTFKAINAQKILCHP